VNSSSGEYYLGAIADIYNNVQESDETTTALPAVRTIVIGPDLMMTAVAGPSTGSPAARITVSNTIAIKRKALHGGVRGR